MIRSKKNSRVSPAGVQGALNTQASRPEPETDDADGRPQSFGSTLRAHRKASGLSRNELAARLKLSLRQLVSIEADRSAPSSDVLERSAKLFGFKPQPGVAKGSRDENTPSKRAWERFKADCSLLARHKVGPAELRMLENLEILGQVTDRRIYVSILKIIREAD